MCQKCVMILDIIIERNQHLRRKVGRVEKEETGWRRPVPAGVQPVQEVLYGVGHAVLHVGDPIHPLHGLRHLGHRVHVPPPAPQTRSAPLFSILFPCPSIN
jgi:hypothetical protein